MRKFAGLAILIFLAGCGTSRIKPALQDFPIKKYAKHELLKDFDLMVNSFKEAHAGIYRYSTKEQFDSIVKIQRSKVTDGLNGLEFYTIAAPVVAFIKEDHCDIKISAQESQYIKVKGKFLPLVVISLNKEVYILNNPGVNLKGFKLLQINNVAVYDVYKHIFNTFAADGFIETSKFNYLDHNTLAIEYAKTIGQPDNFKVVVENASGRKETHVLNAINYNSLRAAKTRLENDGIIIGPKLPASFEMTQDYAVLTINTFSNKKYKAAGLDFKEFIKESFDKIKQHNILNLIVDIRENGGGSEGNEDLLFSYFARKEYKKYNYVKASAFTFSFLEHTDYREPDDRKELESNLKEEHYAAPDGRILRRQGIESPTLIQADPYNGNICILISGWTYSGGAEFSSLMKEHTNAYFIGEETGGAYHGNTSGYSIELTLPATGLVIDIPLLEFDLNVTDKCPFGRGIIPDKYIQPTIDAYLEGTDTEMIYAKQFIINKH